MGIENNEKATFASPCLNQEFPLGTKVILQNLSCIEYNGQEGVVISKFRSDTCRFGVQVGSKKIAVKASKLRSKEGCPPYMLLELAKIKVPLKAVLGVYGGDRPETALVLVYSDHLGLEALRPARDNFYYEEVSMDSIVGQVYGVMSRALSETHLIP